ncbi:hypothetical protein OG875_13940 [Streptomyces sp. NBC_01498]|uniref:hypothetical protein n=1 Tax=Streptomyces sp. NBC_01498 TaxID=2975870 RepID=UPI002E7AB1DF|nr:hypothetical protein [Streptomyces sp. NBC_01498]WTL25602.1 hypothetical protein OG875_13940 [Streptomyces sp. NBC_01498]
MAELESWTAEYGGLVMGEPDSAISIVAVDGLVSLPDVRSSDLTLVQQHGLYPGDDYLNGRPVTLTVEVYGATDEEYDRALSHVYAAFAPAGPERPFRFRFPGLAAGAAAFVNARPRKRSGPIDLNFAHRVCNVVVELFATDPHIYADAVTTLTLSSPWQGTAPKLRFTSPGSVPALPVIVLDNAKDCVLTDEITGQFFGMNPLAGGFTINSPAQRLTSTDTGTLFNDRITPGSVWPEYGFGEHRLSLTSGAVTRATTAVFSWRDRWV